MEVKDGFSCGVSDEMSVATSAAALSDVDWRLGDSDSEGLRICSSGNRGTMGSAARRGPSANRRSSRVACLHSFVMSKV